MKVLHIAYDVFPQSAPTRIHEALLSVGVDSYIYALGPSYGNERILYGRNYSLGEKAWRHGRFLLFRFFEKILRSLFRVTASVPVSLGVGSLLDRQFLREFRPDVVNLHWVCGNFISAADVAWLAKNFKVVWTLHDSWAFTGGCHVPQTCNKWHDGCMNCPLISKRFGFDLARYVFHQKEKYYAKAEFKVIGVSNWLADCARTSFLFGKKNVYVAHNTLNQSVFKPHAQSVMRDLLGLPQERKLILFGAMNSTSDSNKGFDLIYKAIRQLVKKRLADNFDLLVFGSDKPKNPPNFGAKVHYMGRFRDNLSLSVLYSAADVMIVPSRSEAFPNTVLEALSCGIPVVAFRIGGITDQIEHMKNGYLANPYDSNDLARGIAYVLADDKRREKMGEAGRVKVEQSFNWRLVAEDYIRIYES